MYKKIHRQKLGIHTGDSEESLYSLFSSDVGSCAAISTLVLHVNFRDEQGAIGEKLQMNKTVTLKQQ
jgi:hypothetical protein